MRIKPTASSLVALSVVGVATFGAVGCGSGTPDNPTSASSSDKQVQDMVAARTIFDASADKNWDALPADKKAEYTKLVGGKPEDATRWWNRMKNPPGTNGPTSGAH